MACVWVHLSVVQSTFLPTSLPKGNGSWLYGAGLTVSQTLHKIKVQGVLNKPHYKERKMNTEFWISDTTTCNEIVWCRSNRLSDLIQNQKFKGSSTNPTTKKEKWTQSSGSLTPPPATRLYGAGLTVSQTWYKNQKFKGSSTNPTTKKGKWTQSSGSLTPPPAAVSSLLLQF